MKFSKYELLIPFFLFLLFLAITLPGISWGAPSTWHPDEVAIWSMKALNGDYQFNETNFDYPSLPQYVMFFLGRVVLRFGYTDEEVLIAVRVLSAILAGMSIVLTYFTTRRMGANPSVAGLSGLLLFSVSEMEHNGRFAHNDTYITFFTILTLFLLVNYWQTRQNIWLYGSFLTIGMAASSKYNGISLLLVPVLLYVLVNRAVLFSRVFAALGTLLLGGILTFLGFALGTPKALLAPSFYFGNMIPALLHTGNYMRQPGSVRGVIGQYAVLANGLGIVLFILFMAAFLWACYQVANQYTWKSTADSEYGALIVILLAILALDVPVMISFNYPIRFFLPMMSLLSILAGFFIEHLYNLSARYHRLYPRLILLVIGAVLVLSLARIASVMLLFMNDARIPASQYILSLPTRASLEHTLYPPTIPYKYFRRSYNYPIYFVKVEGDPIPTSDRYIFNTGEAGLDKRKTRFLVVDSFTAEKFDDAYTCAQMQVECNFFKQLATGGSAHYKLIAEFSYTLPRYLPQLDLLFVNPTIRIYERTQ